MKEYYITIIGMGHYYGLTPFKVGYVANSPFTVATGTRSAGGISYKVKKHFKVEVMFITGHSVICKVIEGIKDNKKEKSSVTDNSIIAKDDEKQIIQT